MSKIEQLKNPSGGEKHQPKLLHLVHVASNYITNSNYRFLLNTSLGLNNRLSDRVFLDRTFYAKNQKEWDLDNPTTFNEKLNWLKLNDRKKKYTLMVDKYEAKIIAADIIGSQYIIPNLGVWDTFEQIDFSALPNQFVLKTTHGCGGIVICRDKKELNYKNARMIINKSMRRNYFYRSREWPYKNIRPRIIAEEYMQDGNTKNLVVYKVMNFNGKPEIIQVIQNDKTKQESIDYFDTSWNLLDMRQNYPNSENHLPVPKNLALMIEFSARCSKDFPFLRTDWYEVNGKLYFSEFTFYSDAGMEEIKPEHWNKILGDMIDLTIVSKEI